MAFDHAHGNNPYEHSHPADGMGFGHTLAEHEERGNLGHPAYATSEPKTDVNARLFVNYDPKPISQRREDNHRG